MSIALTGLEVKVKFRVSVRNVVGGTSIVNRGQLGLTRAHVNTLAVHGLVMNLPQYVYKTCYLLVGIV